MEGQRAEGVGRSAPEEPPPSGCREPGVLAAELMCSLPPPGLPGGIWGLPPLLEPEQTVFRHNMGVFYVVRDPAQDPTHSQQVHEG